MALFDNKSQFVKDDLKKEITSGSKISIAAASFSIYAFEELKEQLREIDELRFIFTTPVFLSVDSQTEISDSLLHFREEAESLCGTQFEIKLKNKLTQKSIAKECAAWIKKKCSFKANRSCEKIQGFLNIKQAKDLTYIPFHGFTTVDIGSECGNSTFNYVVKLEAAESHQLLSAFNDIWDDPEKLQDVTKAVLDNITIAYRENSPDFIYFVTLYNIFSEFLDDISEDVLPNEGVGYRNSKIWNKLYDFQRDAVLAIINKLERYNGCILADSVGLGKTFSALAVIKYYEDRNKNVLVLCPKKLANNWNTFKGQYVNNPIAEDRLRYDVLFHTDLSRTRGQSNGLDLALLRWDTYDLIVIDESHNFRNGGKSKDSKSRYAQLMNRVLRSGVKTKVLMLSATPVNNRFADLKNQLELAYEGNAWLIEDQLNTTHSVDSIFQQAQLAFNTWSKYSSETRTAESLLKLLDFDFFELLDSVTIARSRRHIEKYYDTDAIGKFPDRLPPLSPRPALTLKENSTNYHEIYDLLQQLTLLIYLPSIFIRPDAFEKYGIKTGTDDDSKENNPSRIGHEKGIRSLMSIALLKRLESSVHSFRLTLERVLALHETTLKTIELYERSALISSCELPEVTEDAILNAEDDESELFTIGKKKKINLADMNFSEWKTYITADIAVLKKLIISVEDITPVDDNKLQTLFAYISQKVQNPVNEGNKKIIIFTAFSDTADYLYKHVSRFAMQTHQLHTAVISGSNDGTSTIPRLRMDMNTVLTLFSPISKEKHLLYPDLNTEIDILIATDCISEGQNLQDCDYLINYDIHWNPVRIIQRFGRIDRIGSKNSSIQLVNFWPDVTLDDYIQLKERVETRMKITIMTATGDENPIEPEEDGELEYRRKQLERLQNEVVDIEEMNTGITIMDLGLNEFRMDLLEYIKRGESCQNVPRGLYAVAQATQGLPPGVFFVLRNVNPDVDIDRQNRLHPFYMIYVGDNGKVRCHHLAPKTLLDSMRLLCKGKTEPLLTLCHEFNKETADGSDMKHYSDLLKTAVESMVSKKKESDIDSLFRPGGTSVLENQINDLSDFELVCFLVVK